MSRFNYGIDNSTDKVVSIADISIDQTGTRCNCICPICRTPLEACSLDGKVQRYFRHASSNRSCSTKASNESALHLLAKEIIHEEHKIFIPKLCINLEDVGLNNIPLNISSQIEPYQHQPEKVIECLSVEYEKSVSTIKPDITIHTNANKKLLVEIVVTHDIDEKKKKRISKIGIATLRINLSEFTDKPITKNALREIITSKPDLKDWFYYPKTDNILKRAKEYYELSPILKSYLNKPKQQFTKKDLYDPLIFIKSQDHTDYYFGCPISQTHQCANCIIDVGNDNNIIRPCYSCDRNLEGEDLKACYKKFENICLQNTDIIELIERNAFNFVTKVIIDSNGEKKEYNYESLIYRGKTIFELWDELKPNVAIFYNVPKRYYVKIGKNPYIQARYGKVNGYLSFEKYEFYSERKEIYYADKPIWECVWKK